MLLSPLWLPLLATLADFTLATPLDKRVTTVRTTARVTPKLATSTKRTSISTRRWTITRRRSTTSTKKSSSSTKKSTSTAKPPSTTPKSSSRRSTSTAKPASTTPKPSSKTPTSTAKSASTTSRSSSKSTSATKPSSTAQSTSSTSSKPSSTSSSSRTSSSSTSTSSTYVFTPSPWPEYTPKSVPPMGNAYDYGSSWDPNFPNMYRDGGGGITVAGVNLMTFSDTYTTNGGLTGSWTSFQANTFSYAGTNASDATMMQSFGSGGKPNLAVSLLPNETFVGSNGRYCIWPSNSLIPYNIGGQEVAIGVMPMLTNLVGGIMNLNYNTLVKVVMTPSGPVTTRLVAALFYATEIPFGSFGLLKGPDGYTYLFAEDTTGLKAARVQSLPATAITNRTLYQYYNAGNWTSQMPAIGDTTSNIFNYSANYFGTIVGPASGEMFFSPYHNTYVIVFMNGFVDGTFLAAYSTTGAITGPWSKEQVIYQPPWPEASWNYAGHAYPGMDPSGKTLTLSYTYGGNFINIVKVTWCDPMDPTCGSSQNGFGTNGTSYRTYKTSTSTSSSSSSIDTATATPTSFLTSSSSSGSPTPTETSTTPPPPPNELPATTTTDTTSTSSTIPDPTTTSPATLNTLIARKVPTIRKNPLTFQQWIAGNGPCKLKYSGCNVIPTKIDPKTNRVLAARVLMDFVKPVGRHWTGKGRAA